MRNAVPMGVLASTAAVGLATYQVMLASSLVHGRGISGALSDTLFAGPLFVFAVWLYWLTRRRTGFRDLSGLLSPWCVGVFLAWLPNLVVLGALSLPGAVHVMSTGEHLGEGSIVYFMVIIGWFFSIVAGAIGATVTAIVRDRQEWKRTVNRKNQDKPTVD
jgi:hypothetical protein